MYTPFKMKGKSPMMKKLIGNQHRLPAELKAKIEAAPESPSKMKKSAAKMKKASMTKMKKESMAKLKKSAAKLKKGKINPFSAEYRRMTNKQRERKYGADYKDRIQGKTKKDGTKLKPINRKNIGEALNKTKKKINKLNENIQQGAETLSKNLKKTKQIKIADKLKLPKKGEGTSSKSNDNKGDGKIPWKTVPAVGTTARTKWYKKYNLKLDDTTPALMKKSAAKMKKSPAKLIKRKTDREKLNKLVEKRTKLNKKKDEREAKGKKTKRVTRRIERVQKKINKNPKAQEDRKNAPKPMDKMSPEPMNKNGEKRTPRSRRNSFLRGAVKKK